MIDNPQKLYDKLNNGILTESNFLSQLRKDSRLKSFITPLLSFNDTISILQNKNLISRQILKEVKIGDQIRLAKDVEGLGPKKKVLVIKNQEQIDRLTPQSYIILLKSKLEEKKEDEYINQPDYEYYVFDKNQNKIISGWEYRDDAQDHAKELDDNFNPKVFSKKYLISLGMNPEDNINWGTDHIDENIYTNNISSSPVDINLLVSKIREDWGKDSDLYQEILNIWLNYGLHNFIISQDGFNALESILEITMYWKIIIIYLILV